MNIPAFYSVDTIQPYFPKVALQRPDKTGVVVMNADGWGEWLFVPGNGYPQSEFLRLEEALQVGTYRSLYRCLPDRDDNGQILYCEDELRDLVMALWPSCRSKSFVTRCKAGWHIQRLRAAAEK